MKPLRDAACEAAARGWFVHPLRPASKRPATKHGLHDATDDIVQVFEWWEDEVDNNVAISCHASALVVIDIDIRHGGDETFAIAESKLGRLPRTVSAETGGGGTHYYFQDPGVPVRGKLGDGVDIKSHGYVLLAPSLHPSGRRYEWDEHPDEVEVARLPDEWLEVVTIATRQRNVGAIPEGSSPDPLRRIPADEYIPRLTGREPNGDGFWTCPFHRNGQERTPSLTADGTLWACYGCEAPPGQRAMGGNIYTLAGLILGFAMPLRGIDYLETKAHIKRMLNA